MPSFAAMTATTVSISAPSSSSLPKIIRPTSSYVPCLSNSGCNLSSFLPSCRNTILCAPSTIQLLFRLPSGSLKRNREWSPLSPVILMEWQDCMVKMEVDVPASVAYNCYSDRESMPHWMPFISSVKILEDKPDLSRWSLKYGAFGRDVEFSWLARNLQPIPNQKIHWISLDGLPNRGAVRFFPKGPSSCIVELTVSYEVPQILVPVAAALQPFLQGLLRQGLEGFSKYAEGKKSDSA